MQPNDFDISDLFTREEELPRPQWDLLVTLVQSLDDPAQQRAAWASVDRQWLARLGEALGPAYRTAEANGFLVLAPDAETAAGLAWFADRCRDRLLTALPGVAAFADDTHVVVVLGTPEEYYQYVAPFDSEGRYGASAGSHVRSGRPHIVLQRGDLAWQRETTLAHELTHSALHHLGMPAWLEEGLAQMFEHDMTGRTPVQVTETMAAEQKRYWGRRGLGAFWSGEGFSRPGRVQGLCYALAEILARLLAADAEPGWFARSRKRRERFLAFLGTSAAADGGEAAYREHLGYGVGDLAARFLGPGTWAPTLPEPAGDPGLPPGADGPDPGTGAARHPGRGG